MGYISALRERERERKRKRKREFVPLCVLCKMRSRGVDLWGKYTKEQNERLLKRTSNYIQIEWANR